MRTTLLFVCQPGYLELQSRILAASIAEYASEQVSVVAAVPSGHTVSDNTLQFLEAAGAQVRFFEPRTWREFNYPIGNKVDALAALQDGDYAVFLDSDMLACRPFSLRSICSGDVFAGRIFSQMVFGTENLSHFEEFAKEMGIELRFNITPEDVHPPRIIEAFNAGLVGVRVGSEAADQWQRLTRRILASAAFPKRLKRTQADQIALCCIRADAAFDFRVVDRAWNSGKYDRRAPPYFFHYFRTFLLMSNEVLCDKLKRWSEEYERFGVRLLGEIRLRDIEYLYWDAARRARVLPE